MIQFVYFKKAFAKLNLTDPYLAKEVGISNLRRIYWLAITMSVVHVTAISAFLIKSTASPIEEKWRMSIIIAHTLMLALILIFGFFCWVLDRKKLAVSPAAYLVRRATGISYLIFGAVLAVMDQMIINSITPYMIACIALAVTILNRPIDSLIDYTLAFVVLFLLMPMTQTNGDILLSLQINGVSVAGLGLALSIISWRTFVIGFNQKRLIEEQKKELEDKNQQLEMLAACDSLTELNNRMRFIHLAQNEVARMRRTGRDSSLIVMDIDFFKDINDRFGHPDGDVILRNVAMLLKTHLRDSDIPARLGGDEFVILLVETPLLAAVEVAGKLREIIENHNFHIESKTVNITVSFGVASLSADDPDPFKTAYKAADKALYLAKDNGRNRVETA
ncbi:MAG: diguanylate cyclase [Ignavibacteriales bacterium]